MKLKSIAALVKRAGVLEVWDDGKWIGTGEAMYASPLPELDADQIMTVLDLSEKDREKIQLREATERERGVHLVDTPQENTIGKPELSLRLAGESFLPFALGRSAAFFREELLTPLKDCKETLRVSCRYDDKGAPYLVISAGWMVLAMLRPCKAEHEILSGLLENYARVFTDLAGRTAAQNVDPETGEVLE